MDTSGSADLPVEAADDTLRMRRVFGEAYEADGTLVVPVAKVSGGGGDLNRVILGGQLVGALALLVLARAVRKRQR